MDEDVRILHVDDDPDICSVTALHLEDISAEFAVESVTDPGAALRRVAENGFDCLVSDFDMPGMDGLELLDAVRGDHPDLPFILLTGKGSEEIASRAIGAGVTGYLQKGTGTEQYEMLANRITNAVDRNRSKDALVDSQRRLGLLVDRSPIAVIEWNAAFEVSRWNDAATETFGYTAAEATGNHASFLFADPTDPGAVEDHLRASGGNHSRRTTVTRNGDRRTTEWHNLAVEDWDGRFSLVQDVTERHERAVELERYETMVETVADGVYTLDDELRFTAVNEGMVELTGYDREELVGAHLSLVLDGDGVERVERGRKRTRAGDSDVNSLDLTLRTADGHRVACAVRYRVQRADGAFTGTVGVFRPVA